MPPSHTSVRSLVQQTADNAFLEQANNISAIQIRRDADARRAAAAEAAENDQENSGPSSAAPAAPGAADEDDAEVEAEKNKRRKKTDAAVAKIKASKGFKKRKRKLGSDDEDEEDLVRSLTEARAPLPGQMDNCAVCGKRFTVTPYSRAAPDGGLLCNPCGKELDKEGAAPKRQRKVGGPIGRRRKVQSKILDGTYHLGAKSLMTLCIETLAKNIDLAEDLGDLPDPVVDKVARILSKRRLLDPRTLSLFLQPTAATVNIYDGGRLGSDDMLRIFQAVPGLKNLKVRNGVQFKDEVMEYLLDRKIELESLYLHGANLLAEELWNRYLSEKGSSLSSLKVYYTDKHFGDETLKLLPKTCPSLKSLKVCHNQKVTGEGIQALAGVTSLEHLGIELHNTVHSDVYVALLSKIGANLKTISVRRGAELDNTVLDALHAHARSLQKLRLNDSEVMTDEGFSRLFTGWANPPLSFVDLQKCRQVDASHPRENPDGIGLCSKGFTALMAHSGSRMRHLNLHACRHISAAAFEEAFGAGKLYPELESLEISFCEQVTDLVVGLIFRACPNIREVNIFGCMRVKDVRVPKGKILVGVPNAQGMHIEGEDD